MIARAISRQCPLIMSILKTLELQSNAAPAPLTQKQIAEHLGVSRQLVGFALRGEGRMADEVRQQILEVAQRNGYHRYSNSGARTLAARRYGKRAATGMLAVLFEATFDDQPLSEVPFFIPFFAGLETEAIRQGLDLVLCALRPGELPRLVSERQVDGIVSLAAPIETLNALAQLDLPLVSVLYGIEGFPSLQLDNANGARLAARHLIELGHRRIAYLGLEKGLAAARLSAFRRALDERDLLDETCIVSTDGVPSRAVGAQLMTRLLERHRGADLPFTALACYNDMMAMGAIEVLQTRGLRVPADVSVVGFDDVSLQYSFAPALTSIGFSRQEIGKRAIQRLCQSDDAGGPEIFPVELVQRDSTRPL